MNKFNILYIKTPKTASELIKRYLIEYAKIAELNINNNSLSKFFLQKNFEICAEHIMMTPEIIKHFYSSNNKNYNSLIFTSIREPLNRMVSHYYYSNLYRNEMSFDEWYQNYYYGRLEKYKFGWGTSTIMGDREPIHYNIDNYQLNYLGVSNPTDVYFIYDFIFLSEKVEEQISLVESILDVKITRYEGKNFINNNNNYPKNIKVSKQTENLFKERNQKDYELYNFVSKNYN